MSDFMTPDRVAAVVIFGPFLAAAMFVGIMVHFYER